LNKKNLIYISRCLSATVGRLRRARARRRCTLLLAGALLLVGCAGYSGSGLQPGVSTLADVLALMGSPTLAWRDADGSEQLAFARGPAGTQTFMVFIAPDGRLRARQGVLDSEHFARIVAGRSNQDAVLRLIGPPVAQWTAYFPARNELVWEWRFCDSWNQVARFSVLFDATTGIVRTTQQQQELAGFDGVAPFCGH